MLRHGDITFKPQDELPEDAEKLNFDGSFIAARGEATGHHHTITAKKEAVEVYKDKNGQHWLKIKEGAKITHPEHDTLTFEPGVYKQEEEREYDYFQEEIKKVID